MQKLEEIIPETCSELPRKSRAGLVLLLAVLAAALLLPVWIVQYPPLLDYPNHLARSFILSHIHDSAYQFSRYFTPQWGPCPYLTMDAAFIAAQFLFPVAIAGKIVLSLCLLGVPLACWWFVRNANPDNDWLALWGLFIASSQFFLESFLAFQLGIIACFFMLGFWLRWKNQINIWRWFALLLLTQFIYFSHLIGFILAGFVVTMYLLYTGTQSILRSDQKRRASLISLRELLVSWALFLPGSILYLVSGLGTHNGTYLHFRTAQDKFDEITHILFGGYSLKLATACSWIAIACLALGWIRNRKFRWKWPWIFVAFSALILYAVLPYSYGETFDIDVRVLPVFFILTFAVANFGARRAKIVGAVALLLFGIRTFTIVRTFQAEQPELNAISRGVSMMEPNALMLPIVQPRHDDDPNRWPYEHFWSWAVIQRGAFSPYLFDLPGQTPMRITYDTYTPDAFWDSEYEDGDVDWEQVQQNYDYVWLYNVDGYAPKLDKIGTCISQYGAFRLYRIRRIHSPQA